MLNINGQLTEIFKLIEELKVQPQTARQLAKKVNFDKKIINKILYTKDFGFSSEKTDSVTPLWSFNKCLM